MYSIASKGKVELLWLGKLVERPWHTQKQLLCELRPVLRVKISTKTGFVIIRFKCLAMEDTNHYPAAALCKINSNLMYSMACKGKVELLWLGKMEERPWHTQKQFLCDPRPVLRVSISTKTGFLIIRFKRLAMEDTNHYPTAALCKINSNLIYSMAFKGKVVLLWLGKMVERPWHTQK